MRYTLAFMQMSIAEPIGILPNKPEYVVGELFWLIANAQITIIYLL